MGVWDTALERADRMWDYVHERPGQEPDYATPRSMWPDAGFAQFLLGSPAFSGNYAAWGEGVTRRAPGVEMFMGQPRQQGAAENYSGGEGVRDQEKPQPVPSQKQAADIRTRMVWDKYLPVLYDPNASELEKQTAREILDKSVGAATAQSYGDVNQQRQMALAYARQLFGEEGARVLNATFEVEGGWTGAVGDTDLDPAGSHGPLQFYGGGGMLNVFAREKGFKDLALAGEYIRSHPLEAVIWALHGYYGAALRAGLDAGLRGPQLAEYVQRYAQRSKNPERAAAAYNRLYGPQAIKAH